MHCLVPDGAVRSSPCRPHHENFGRNLYHMFVPAYFASQSLFCFELWYSSCFEVKCWFHTFPNRCSHTPMWILIPHDNRDCHVNPFQPGCFLFKWIRSLQHLQDHLLVFSNVVQFICPQVAFVFPAHPLFLFKDSNFLIKCPSYSCEVSSFFSFNVRIRWFSGRF